MSCIHPVIASNTEMLASVSALMSHLTQSLFTKAVPEFSLVMQQLTHHTT